MSGDRVPNEAIVDLLRKAAFSFVGTVEHLGAATMADVPVDDRTAVVRSTRCCTRRRRSRSSPAAASRVQLAARRTAPRSATQAAFFANGLAFGDSLALTEVGRVPASEVEPHLTAAAAAAGEPPPSRAPRAGETTALRAHAGGRRDRARSRDELEKVLAARRSPSTTPTGGEATLQVDHVERGDVEAGRADGALREQPRRPLARRPEAEGRPGRALDPARDRRAS